MARTDPIVAAADPSGRRVRALSYGGGLDSFAMLVDAIARDEKPDLCVFADVADPKGKDPGEWPGTYQHIREIAMPLAKYHDIEFVWLDTDEFPIRGERSLFRYFESKHIMPSRQSRLCTSASKVERISEYLERRFGQYDGGVEVWIGFEKGEEKRAERDPHAAGLSYGWRVNRFPLMEQNYCRCRCEALVREQMFEIPRKSACTFCPFSTRGDFQTLAREAPKTFERVVSLEENCRLTKSGKRITYGYKFGDERDPSLAEWIEPEYRRQRIPCEVCGAPVRATKAVGCDYLTPEEAVVIPG